MMNNVKSVSDWKLERYLLGELPADEIASIAALESSDHELRERVSGLRASDAEILERYPPEQAAKRIANMYEAQAAVSTEKLTFAEKLERNISLFNIWDRISVPARAAAAFAAVLLAVTVPMILPRADSETMYEDRVKGAPSAAPAEAVIEVWRKEGDTAVELEHGSLAREGDIIQLRYEVPEQCYGVLVSMDGRSVMTIHLSGEQGKAAMLLPGKPVALKYSYELDDAPHYEKFYLIMASESFGVDEVMPMLNDKAYAIDGLRVTTFTLIKSHDIGMN